MVKNYLRFRIFLSQVLQNNAIVLLPFLHCLPNSDQNVWFNQPNLSTTMDHNFSKIKLEFIKAFPYVKIITPFPRHLNLYLLYTSCLTYRTSTNFFKENDKTTICKWALFQYWHMIQFNTEEETNQVKNYVVKYYLETTWRLLRDFLKTTGRQSPSADCKCLWQLPDCVSSMPAEGQRTELSRFSWESAWQKIGRHSDCVEGSLQPIATEDLGGC